MEIGLGSHAIQSFALGLYGNATIAASALGTAAATIISKSASLSYAKSMEIWNLTGVHLDLVFGPDNTSASYTTTTPGLTPVTVIGNGTLFCPGNTSVSVNECRSMRFPIAFSQGMAISVRTINATPVTCAATNPFIINFWA